jgi:hypothetical protein
MKRHFEGLHCEGRRRDDALEGPFLVRVDRVYFRWHPQRPFYILGFAVLQPAEHRGQLFTGRLYCSQKALWKLRWFLRDFGYDQDLMGRDEVDERALVGLKGVVRVSHTTLNQRTFLNLSGFASASEWDELPVSSARKQEMSHDV